MTEANMNLSPASEILMNLSTVAEVKRLELELCQNAWCGTRVAIVLVVTLLTVGGNLLNLVVLVKAKPFNEVANILLVSLATSDLILGCGCLSLAFYSALYQANLWPYNSQFLCSLSGVIGVGCLVVSAMTLMWLAVDRYLFITHPMQYLSLATRQKAMGVATTTWLIGMGVCLGAFARVPPAEYWPKSYFCSLNFAATKALPYTFFVVIYVPVICITSYCYGWVFVIAVRQRKRIAAEAATLSSQPPESRKNYKALRTTLTVVGAFCLTSAPFNMREIYKLICGIEEISFPLEFLTSWLFMSNGLLNPIIFGVQNRVYRQGFIQIFTGNCSSAGTVTSEGTHTQSGLSLSKRPAKLHPSEQDIS